MGESFIIGRYVPGQSLIHKLDPRLKIGIVFIYVLIVFSAKTFESYLVLFSFAIISCLLTKVRLSFIVKGLKPIWFIIVITFLLHIFLTRDGEVLFEIIGWPIYKQAILQALEVTGRLFLLILMTTLLTITTTPIEITDAIEADIKTTK